MFYFKKSRWTFSRSNLHYNCNSFNQIIYNLGVTYDTIKVASWHYMDKEEDKKYPCELHLMCQVVLYDISHAS